MTRRKLREACELRCSWGKAGESLGGVEMRADQDDEAAHCQSVPRTVRCGRVCTQRDEVPWASVPCFVWGPVAGYGRGRGPCPFSIVPCLQCSNGCFGAADGVVGYGFLGNAYPKLVTELKHGGSASLTRPPRARRRRRRSNGLHEPENLSFKVRAESGMVPV